MKCKKFVIDIDGVIAELRSLNDYENAEPIKRNIEIINGLYCLDSWIVLFTARGFEKGIDWRYITKKQMSDWGVEYHELIFGKPSADFYIDDKSITLDMLVNIYDLSGGLENG